MRRTALALGLIAGLGACGAMVVGPGLTQWRLVAAADDPVALTDLRLDEAATAARITIEIDAAIAARDPELAESFMALASERRIVVSEDQTSRLRALNDGAIGRAVTDFGHGLLAGERESGAALAGAVAGDVIGFGDLRDLAAQGRRWLDGQGADPTVLALAAAGLALSAATWVSFGGALPARNGLSVVKAASKARLLSPALSANLGRAAVQAIDRPALAATLAAAGRLDLAAARQAGAAIVRRTAATRFAALGQDAGTLYARTGQRGLRQVLAVAEDAGDIAKAARLSVAKGSTFRATVKMLGRGALALGALSLSAVGWMLALVGYALALAMLAQRLGWRLGRWLIPAPRRA